MAFNKFVKPINSKPAPAPRHRVITETPEGLEYEFDPMMDGKKMTEWEVTAAIGYFLEIASSRNARQQRSKPNRFVHFQRH